MRLLDLIREAAGVVFGGDERPLTPHEVDRGLRVLTRPFHGVGPNGLRDALAAERESTRVLTDAIIGRR